LKLVNEQYLRILDSLNDGVYFVDRHRQITYWNQGAESLSGYSREEIVGTHCSDNTLVHVDEQGVNLCVNGCPLSKAMVDGRECEAEAFLHHKDGHRLRVSVKAIPVFDEDGEVIGAVEVFKDLTHQEALQKKMEQLEEMALLDPLTRLANRRHVEASLQRRLEEFTRYGWNFGVLFIDVDHFKSINDEYGHDVGDKVLKLVSLTLQNSLRPFDFLGRWGGEEFVALVVNVNEKQLVHIAERARRLLEQSQIQVADKRIQVTVSIGATMAERADNMGDLVKRADQLMYRAKSGGRNRVFAEARP